GRNYKQVGSNVLAPGGNINISAQNIDIEAGQNTYSDQTQTSFTQSGFTVSLSSPLISAGQTAFQMASAAGHVSDPRMKALAGATTAFAGYNAYNAVEANPSSLGGFSLNLSFGSYSDKETTSETSTQAVGSTLNAGGDINLIAT